MNTRRLYCLSLILLVLLVLPQGAWAQIQELVPADSTPSPSFGVAVALDGHRALVGDSGEDVCGRNSGAAYLFEPDAAGRWRQVARLVPKDCRPGAFFGRSLALSGDRALIGASNEFFADEESNVAYVFERNDEGIWQETAQLTVEPEQAEGPFAASVDLDGNRALITTLGNLDAGRSDGAAYLFEHDTSTGQWHQAARLHKRSPSAGIFGGMGALDGNRAVVTASTYLAYEPGSVYLFERGAEGAWHETARFDGVNDFFIAVALWGPRVLVGEARTGSNQAGRASLYARNRTGRWHRAATLRPRTPYDYGGFGSAVSLDSMRALITGYDEQLGLDTNIDRVVYVFAYDAARQRWRQRQIIDIGEPTFGTAIDHQGRIALIGNAREQAPGAAYIVRLR